MGGVGWLVPGLSPSTTIRVTLTAIPGVMGLVMLLMGWVQLRQADSPLSYRQPETTAALLTGGAFSLSRHPMYTGQGLLVLAWAFYLSDPMAWIFVPLWWWFINRFQVIPEETALLRLFGVSYESYSHRVSRWLW
jgi:protein-S-isoprenylcysteine O-methyltransferase Ste14